MQNQIDKLITQATQTPEEKIAELEAKVAMYEKDGTAKLFYALQRKSNEMADVLNSNPLSEIDLTDTKSKQFDRIKAIWSSATEVATAINMLGQMAKVTGNEKEDIAREPAKQYGITPESISSVLQNR